MSEMVERVARAISKARFLNGGNEDDDGWDSATPAMQDDYRKQARAAIAAMREPTEGMVATVPDEGGMVYANWVQMIEAALK